MTTITSLVDMTSGNNQQGVATDKYAAHANTTPFFMKIDIAEPTIGGDAASSDWMERLSSLKGIMSETGEGLMGVGNNILINMGINSETGRTDDNENRQKLKAASKLAASIALPMPLELAFNDGVNWADDNTAQTDIFMALGAAALGSMANASSGSPLGSLFSAISAHSAASALSKIGQKNIGIGFEPRKEMYFKGPEFREFTFNWKLAPKNQTEAQAILNTVKLIRRHQRPHRLSDDMHSIGFEVWKLPSTFTIKFMHGASENPYLPKIKPVVVSNVTTSYSPHGNWRAFRDGAPISEDLSITFKEVEVVTQNDIDEGY